MADRMHYTKDDKHLYIDVKCSNCGVLDNLVLRLDTMSAVDNYGWHLVDLPSPPYEPWRHFYFTVCKGCYLGNDTAELRRFQQNPDAYCMELS